MSLVYLELSSGFSFYLEWKPTSLLSSIHKTYMVWIPFMSLKYFLFLFLFFFVFCYLFFVCLALGFLVPLLFSKCISQAPRLRTFAHPIFSTWNVLVPIVGQVGSSPHFPSWLGSHSRPFMPPANPGFQSAVLLNLIFFSGCSTISRIVYILFILFQSL